jgi:hypothetical protein
MYFFQNVISYVHNCGAVLGPAHIFQTSISRKVDRICDTFCSGYILYFVYNIYVLVLAFSILDQL